jgi:Tfp pilus assembly ATPase PilU
MSEGYDMKDLLWLVVTERAEKLTLHSGQPPIIRVRGESHTLEGPALTLENADSLLRNLASTRYMREFYGRRLVAFNRKVAFSHISPDSAEFRVEAKLVGDDIQIDLDRVAV